LILILNRSPYSPDLVQCNYFFVFETKNEAEGKAVRHYFGHLEGFDQSNFDHLKRNFLM